MNSTPPFTATWLSELLATIISSINFLGWFQRRTFLFLCLRTSSPAAESQPTINRASRRQQAWISLQQLEEVSPGRGDLHGLCCLAKVNDWHPSASLCFQHCWRWNSIWWQRKPIPRLLLKIFKRSANFTSLSVSYALPERTGKWKTSSSSKHRHALCS